MLAQCRQTRHACRPGPRPDRALGVLLVLSLSISACSESPTGHVVEFELADALTPGAEAELTPEGFFPSIVSLKGVGETVSPERARELASAFVTTFGRVFEPTWSRWAERQIRIEELKPLPRVLLAQSPYRPVANSVHPGVRKFVGPHYFVTLAQAGDPILSVAVSAYNTDVDIENGRLDLPARHGNDFFVEAIPPQAVSLPLPPEEAVRIAASTGAKVTAAPVLVAAPAGFSPHHARWRVSLDRSVTVDVLRPYQRGGPTTLAVREVFVGVDGKLQVPESTQPALTHITQPSPTGRGAAPLELTARAPTQFQGVTASQR